MIEIDRYTWLHWGRCGCCCDGYPINRRRVDGDRLAAILHRLRTQGGVPPSLIRVTDLDGREVARWTPEDGL